MLEIVILVQISASAFLTIMIYHNKYICSQILLGAKEWLELHTVGTIHISS